MVHKFKGPQFFKHENALIDYLIQEHSRAKGKVCIIAGHYMLAYDSDKHCFRPLISQELHGTKLFNLANEIAGDLPVYSLDLALKIQECIKEKEAKVTIVVNDRQILNRKHCSDTDIGILRKKYFADNCFPKPFHDLLFQRKNSIASMVMDNNNKDRTTESVLPKKTFLFSEQVLRNRFKYTEKKLRTHKGYSLTDNQLFFHGDNNERICLVQDGQCGCSGEVLQLFIDLHEINDIRQFIFFSPPECKDAVYAACKVMLSSMNSISAASVVSSCNNFIDRNEKDYFSSAEVNTIVNDMNYKHDKISK